MAFLSLIALALLAGLATSLLTPERTFTPPLDNNPLSFGGNGRSELGWLMPANTVLSTSYVSKQQLSHFVSATIGIYPYQIQPGTILHLSLYLDDRLVSTRQYDLSSSSSQTQAKMRGLAGNDVANFSDSMLGYGVSKLDIATPLPIGTKATVLVWANNPIWIQIDGTPTTVSHEFTGSNGYASPSVLQESEVVSSHTLSVQLESSPN